ncbi:pep-cterm sorting domain-containing protein [Anaeramoeba ignava]|uniref:Pep-cterm sorting domain-containing protein n=1 Tax=Anaeramoeba ignava TaxID=1746090 RepID=A0A9Q0LJH6_ANAIG|nr:pep-cterm sorting domain-containing protein [Anaeramoeba ignava]
MKMKMKMKNQNQNQNQNKNKTTPKERIISDLISLYSNEESKDFSIISNEGKKIKAHKFILAARSELFRGMFLTVTEDSTNEVKDYTGKSTKALETIIKFLYYDEIEKGLEMNIYEELEEAEEFFQFSEYSLFKQKLNLVKKELKNSN